jgi:hypothetical protein
MELQLFRLKVFGPSQPGLFDASFLPAIALRDAVLGRPTSRVRRGVAWHIGNTNVIDDHGLYFRLGRMSKATMPFYDEETGDFVQEEVPNAPFTHVLLDWQRELCAVARKQTLARTTQSLARRLVSVLNEGTIAQERGYTFSVGPVRDPAEFIEVLLSAYSLRSFTYTFERKNLFNAHEDFVQPFEKLVAETNAQDGKIVVKGQDLAVAPITEIARSAATTGDDASARLVLEEVSRSLTGDTASIAAEELDSDTEKKQALDAARAEHDRIAGSSGGEAA